MGPVYGEMGPVCGETGPVYGPIYGKYTMSPHKVVSSLESLCNHQPIQYYSVRSSIFYRSYEERK